MQMEEYKDQIILGDSLQVLKQIKTESVDLVITSPPYFQQRDYGNGNSGNGNEQTEKEYLDNLSAIFFETVRVTKPTGAIVYNIGDKYSEGGLRLIPYQFAIRAIKSGKVFLVNEIKWIKLNPTPRQDKRKLIPSAEPFFIFAKSKEYYFDLNSYLKHLDEMNKNQRNNPSGKLGQKYFELIDKSDLSENEKNRAKKELQDVIRSVYTGEISSFRMKIRGIHKPAYGGQAGGRNDQIINNGFTIIRITGDRLKKDIIESPVEITKDNKHPAVYPLYIIQELIKLLSKPGDIVLDPFNGSGTTCLAAKNLNRHYIGIEINPEYVELADNRLKRTRYCQELFIIYMNEQQILEQAYYEARKLLSENRAGIFNDVIRNDIDFLIAKIEKNKSIVSAMITSLVKKISEPAQDIRLHRTDFDNGYSARSLDTKFTTPFFKKYFPKYANKESSFLTLATRERIRWTKDEGKGLKIRDKKLRDSFLNVFEQIEIGNKHPKEYLTYLFCKLIELSMKDDSIFRSAEEQNEDVQRSSVICGKRIPICASDGDAGKNISTNQRGKLYLS